MKIRKNISKFLAIGMILNNVYFNTNASNLETPNRYETLEGEHIVIDNSVEGELHGIEIFGNTVQDENNLEDIQSVGDLYVDENGESILDSQGREQYKIEIMSKNKNILSADKNFITSNNGVIVEHLEESNGIKLSEGRAIFSNILNLLPNTYYTFSLNSSGSSDSYILCRAYNSKDNQIGGLVNNKMSFLTDDTGLIYFKFWTASTAYDTPDIYGHYVIYNNIQLEVGKDKTNFINPNHFKQSILLPVQLQKVGDVADRLYWDNEKRRYVIEKKIDKMNIINISVGLESDNYRYGGRFSNSIFQAGISRNQGVFSHGKYINRNTLEEPTFNALYGKVGGGDMFGIKILKTELESEDQEGINKWIAENKPYSYQPLRIPELIETNIIKKLKIPTYNEKTYICVNFENRTNPTLKVTIDRILNVCEKTIQLAQENPTIDNISTARMWINLLEESTLKDNFNNQIDSITQISDLILESKKVSSSLDVYVKSDNALSLTVSTNSVIFENFTGVDDMEKLNAINITVNSSLPYQLNSYLLEEIKNGDGSNKIEKELFNIKLNGETDYKAFNNINEKLVLKDNCLEGNNNQFGIDLIFRGSLSHKADVYKTVIKLEAEQK